MLIHIGIDPGLRGAMAALDGHGHVDVVSMPIIPAASKNGKKQGRDEYDLHAIQFRLNNWADWAEDATLVVIERSQPLPSKMGGSIANFQRGVCRGFAWLLHGLGIPYQLVAPRTWQTVMLAGTSGKDTKQRSIIAAQRLYPNIDLRLSERARKPDHGKSDAVLLAAFGQRTYQGGASE